ncbi:hypothetical protein JW921_04505 [Candidatus Fermentibacterales bacterium]|nr:hypothetical protein [Candidatus Fermentibacterales bacterium]
MSEGRKLSILEKAIRLVPGYKGYKAKEERRDNDHLFRMHLVDRMEKLMAAQREVVKGLEGPGALSLVSDFDRISKKLEKATDEVRFADRGYRGWFDMHKVHEGELDRLYGFDVGLVEDIEQLEQAFESLSSAGRDPDLIRSSVNEIVSLLNDFSAKMTSRKDLMVDLEKNRPID